MAPLAVSLAGKGHVSFLRSRTVEHEDTKTRRSDGGEGRWVNGTEVASSCGDTFFLIPSTDEVPWRLARASFLVQVFGCSGVQVFRTEKVKDAPALAGPEHPNT